MAEGRQCVVGYGDTPTNTKFLRKVGNHSSVISISQEMNAPKQRCENLEQGQSIFQRPTIQTQCLPHSTTYMNKGYRAFPGVNHVGRGTDHAPPLGPGCKRVGAIPPPALCACISMSLGDLYLYLTTSMITQLLYNGYRVISRGKATGARR